MSVQLKTKPKPKSKGKRQVSKQIVEEPVELVDHEEHDEHDVEKDLPDEEKKIVQSHKSRGRPPQPEEVKIKKIIETMSKQSNPNEKLRRKIKYIESKAIPKATARLDLLKKQLAEIKVLYDSSISSEPVVKKRSQVKKQDEEQCDECEEQDEEDQNNESDEPEDS